MHGTSSDPGTFTMSRSSTVQKPLQALSLMERVECVVVGLVVDETEVVVLVVGSEQKC